MFRNWGEVSLGYIGNSTADSIRDSTLYGPHAPVLSVIDRVDDQRQSKSGGGRGTAAECQIGQTSQDEYVEELECIATRSRAGWRYARPNAVPVGHTQQMGQQHNSIPGAGKHPLQIAAVQPCT